VAGAIDADDTQGGPGAAREDGGGKSSGAGADDEDVDDGGRLTDGVLDPQRLTTSSISAERLCSEGTQDAIPLGADAARGAGAQP
jgi:hypothetical protein